MNQTLRTLFATTIVASASVASYAQTTVDNLVVTLDATANTATIKGVADRTALAANYSIPQVLTVSGVAYDVVAVAAYAFEGQTTLTSIEIPASVKTIDPRAFSGCTNLANVNVLAGNTAYSSVDGVVYSQDGSKLVLVPAGKTGNFTPSSTSRYPDNEAFATATGITTFTMPTTFAGSPNLDGATSLTEVIVETPHPNAFESVSGVLYNLYPGWEGIFGVPVAVAGDIVIPEGISSLADNFKDRSKFTSIKFSSTVNSLGGSAFSGCTSLRSVDFGNSAITTIPTLAFANCTSLTSLSIPASVSTIGPNAFAGSGIRELHFANSTAPTGVTSDSFPAGITVYVPVGATGYDTPAWSGVTVVYGTPTGITSSTATTESVSADATGIRVVAAIGTPIAVFNAAGQQVAATRATAATTTVAIAQSGIFVVKVGTASYKIFK